MKKVFALSQVDEDKCIGDKICENVCPTGAIKVVDKKASVDGDKCASCLKCLDVCDQGAIKVVRRERPLTLAVDPSEVNQGELEDLCRKANFDPEEIVCLCTSTPAREVAAAVLKGAKSPEEVALMTGIRTSCGMWCMAPILRLLRAHGIDPTPPKGFRWYNIEPALWNIPEATVNRYPEYRVQEDRDLFAQGILDNLVSTLKSRRTPC